MASAFSTSGTLRASVGQANRRTSRSGVLGGLTLLGLLAALMLPAFLGGASTSLAFRILAGWPRPSGRSRMRSTIFDGWMMAGTCSANQQRRC